MTTQELLQKAKDAKRVLAAITPEDIDRALALQITDARMLAGCAGLADGLARRWQQPQHAAKPVRGPLLILCGSLSPVSAAQMDEARAQGVRLEILPDAFLHAQADSYAIEAGRILSILTHEPLMIRTPAVQGAAPAHSSAGVAQAMGRMFASLVQYGLSSPVLIIGGDTLDACTRCAGAHTLYPIGQPLPGTALLHMEHVFVPLFSKAGGFGGTDTLINLILRTKGGLLC